MRSGRLGSIVCPRGWTRGGIALALGASLLLEAGCASAPATPTLSTAVDRTGVHVADGDAQLSIARLSREQVLAALGWRGQRLADSATVLEVTITPAASSARLAPTSFRLRLPTGEGVDPLEAKWVLAAMDLPGEAAPSGRGEGGWPVLDEPDNVETAMIEIALVSLLVVAIGVKALIESSKSKPRLQARARISDMVALPRTVARGATARLLLVYWPRFGRVPSGIPLPIDVQFELARCTWRAGIVVPAD